MAALWEDRERSTNPVFPYEWEVRYRDGTCFPRLWREFARRAAEAPRRGLLELRITGPTGTLHVPAAVDLGDPDEIVVVARVVRPLHDMRRGAVSSWRFGFRYGPQFVGVVVGADGTVTRHG